MASWIPGNHTLAARLASIMPDDIKTLSQLMSDVKYASLDDDGDGKTHGTGQGQNTDSDKKQLTLRVEKMLSDYKKSHLGATDDDFKQALSAGTLSPSQAGGLSSAQQQELFSTMFSDGMFSGMGTGAGAGA